MLRTVRDACELQPNALDYAIADTVQHLSEVLAATEKDADAFFERNYVTGGMRQLLRMGLQRLAGQSDQAVFELRQAMGGGKTHSMLAFGLLARNPHLYSKVPHEITEGIAPTEAKVVAINGRTVSEDIFLWGDIARQLGKEKSFAKFWKEGARAPSEQDWIQLVGDAPVLMLLDELPPYFDYAMTRVVGGGTLATVTTYALSNLLSAALKLPRLCIVLSNLSAAYEGASRELAQTIRNVQQEAARQAKPLTPVELASNEIYEILRKQLFKRLPVPQDGTVDAVASAYAKALSEATRAKSVAKSAELIADEIHSSYPFHPSVKDVIALFKDNPTWRQTRGLVLFVSKLLKSVWERKTNDVYLIGCQHLDLSLSDVREEINRIGNLQGAIAVDISSGGSAHAEEIDAHLNSDAGSQVARLLLVASLSENVDGVKGLTKEALIERLVAPTRSAEEFGEAFEALRKDAWYLHRRDGDAFYFSNFENLKKRIDNRALGAPQPTIDNELRRRLQLVFEPKRKNAYQEVLALPKIDEINLKGGRVCLVMSPDSRTPPQEAKRFFDAVTEKNNFIVVTGDGSDLGRLEDKVRRIWAIAKVAVELGEKSPHADELKEEASQAAFDFHSAVINLFNRVWYPARSPSGETLAYAPLQLKSQTVKHGKEERTEIDGEEAIEAALTSTGASKLKIDFENEADALIQRAEDILWIGDQKRIPWADVVARSKARPRWPFLPPKGLERLRTIAIGQDRWRYSDDGYIEKGPFPPPKTSVQVIEIDRDENGVATLRVKAVNAGPSGRVHVSETEHVSVASSLVEDEIYKTDATRLWFLAVDPSGKHETGDPVPWSNTITIAHQPSTMGKKRYVALKAYPRGTIRWNTTGANPKEGALYEDRIEITDPGEVYIYAYAEDRGVSAKETFRLPAMGARENAQREIDPDLPAKLKKKQLLDGTGKTFAWVKAAKETKARLAVRTIEIGQGTQNVRLGFGSGTQILPETIERLIAASREALANDSAEVTMNVLEVSFDTGRDLEAFAKALSIDVGPDEVEQ